MRGVKRSALRLLETFVERCDDTSMIANDFVPAMLDPILGDYARGVPDARLDPLATSSCSQLCITDFPHFLFLIFSKPTYDGICV